MQQDFKEEQADIARDMKEHMDSMTPDQLKKHTSAFVERTPLGKAMTPDPLFKQTQIDREYMNFDKYEKNWTKVEDDHDHDPNDDSTLRHLKNFKQAMKRLNLESDQDYE